MIEKGNEPKYLLLIALCDSVYCSYYVCDLQNMYFCRIDAVHAPVCPCSYSIQCTEVGQMCSVVEVKCESGSSTRAHGAGSVSVWRDIEIVGRWV